MRPLLLKGHSRPLTRVKFNREGDMLLTTAKDSEPCLWWAENGERVGTYKGHNGTVWDIDINWDSTTILTGSADQSAKIWDARTGTELASLPHDSGVRCVQWACGGKMFLTVQDHTFSSTPGIYVYNFDPNDRKKEPQRTRVLQDKDSGRVVQAFFTRLNQHIVSGSDDGCLRLWDVQKGECIKKVKAHDEVIQDVQFSQDLTMVITASKDNTAKVWDAETLEHLKTFKSDRPLNSAAFSPKYDQVIVSGGQDAREVTTSSARSGHFEVDFFHLVQEDFLCSVKGHFGPVNTIAFSPTGNSFCSGAEDGYIRLHHFAPDYHKSSKKWTKPFDK